MKKCRACGSYFTDNKQQCPNCGSTDYLTICENCGEAFDSGFCPKCGVQKGNKGKICPVCGKKYFSAACPDCGYTPNKNDTPVEEKNNQIGCGTVLLWIFFLPIMASIAIWKKKEWNLLLKIGLTCLLWGGLILFTQIGTNNSTSSSYTTTANSYEELKGNWNCSHQLITSVYNGSFGFILCLDSTSKTFIAQYFVSTLTNALFTGKYEISDNELSLYDINGSIYGKYLWDKSSDLLTLYQTEGLLKGNTYEFKKINTSLKDENSIKNTVDLQNALLSANILGEAETGIKCASEKKLAEQAEKEQLEQEAQTQQNSTEEKFVGSINSNKYHRPSCDYVDQIKSYNLIYFSSIEEAQNAGYSPCKVCHPNQ